MTKNITYLNHKTCLLCIALLIISPFIIKAEAQTTIAVKSNLLYDAALVPNIGVELPIVKNFSLALDWQYAWWKNNPKHRKWQTYGGYLEGRYWLSQEEKLFKGHHIGLYAQALTYDVEFGGRGYLSARWNYGGGISYGYAQYIGKKLHLDFSIGIGYLRGNFHEYLPEDGHQVYQKTKCLNFFGPTKAEVSLVWNIPIKKGGNL